MTDVEILYEHLRAHVAPTALMRLFQELERDERVRGKRIIRELARRAHARWANPMEGTR